MLSSFHRPACWLVPAFVFSLLVLCSPTVFGGLLTTGLAYDDGGGPWQDSQQAINTTPIFISPPSSLEVSVEYAVFAPGVFDDFLLAEGAVGEADPSDYVYAYQFSVVSATGNGSAIGLTVGTHTDSLVSGPFSVAVAGTDVAPSGGTNAATSVRWDVPAMTSGTTEILYFTSPDGPQFDNLTVAGDPGFVGASFPGLAFSPIPMPEPSSVVLALLAMSSLGFIPRRKRTVRHLAN